MASTINKEDKTFVVESTPSVCTILDLNNDCLLEICEHLDLPELCSFADVCGRFKQNAQSYFELKKLGDTVGPDWCDLTNRARCSFLRNFGSSMSYLIVQGPIFDKYTEFVIEMIVRYCGETLKSLSLWNLSTHGGSVGTFQTLLSSRLEKLDVCHCNFAPSLFDMLPSCAPELRELKLDTGLYGSRGRFKTFPKLEMFSTKGFYDRDFEEFLEKNQQLKTIEVDYHGTVFLFDLIAKCKIQTQNSIMNIPTSYSIQKIPDVAILRKMSSLKKLLLWTGNANFLDKMADAQVPIEFLELRNHNGQSNDNLMFSISKLRTIETLRFLDISNIEQSLFLKMCSSLGELTELYLASKSKWSADTVLKIVQNATKLQKLYAFMPVNFPLKSIIDVDIYMKILNVVNGRNENKYLKIILLDKFFSVDVPTDLKKANEHVLVLTIETEKTSKKIEFIYKKFYERQYNLDVSSDEYYYDSD